MHQSTIKKCNIKSKMALAIPKLKQLRKCGYLGNRPLNKSNWEVLGGVVMNTFSPHPRKQTEGCIFNECSSECHYIPSPALESMGDKKANLPTQPVR